MDRGDTLVVGVYKRHFRAGHFTLITGLVDYVGKETAETIAIFVWSLRQSNITWLVALASMCGASEHKQAL